MSTSLVEVFDPQITRRTILAAGAAVGAASLVVGTALPAFADAEPFLGEIMLFGGNFAPVGWLMCDGSLLPIADYDVLFNLIGTTYGGDGQTTFALPDLRSRWPVHEDGASAQIGQTGGAETVALTVAQMPSHTHVPGASKVNATTTNPTGALPAVATDQRYSTAATDVDLHVMAASSVGRSQPHENRPPYVTVNYIIATSGIFPSQT